MQSLQIRSLNFVCVCVSISAKELFVMQLTNNLPTFNFMFIFIEHERKRFKKAL